MFALYEMRILKAHSSDDQAKLANCLGQFHIDPSEAAAGYGPILDRIYDALIAEFGSVNEKVSEILIRDTALPRGSPPGGSPCAASSRGGPP
jgi:hypothetical protein